MKTFTQSDQNLNALNNGAIDANSIQLTLDFQSASEVISVMKMWKQLEEKIQDVPLMCSYDWTKKWLESYSESVPHRFLVGKLNSEVVGICLLTDGVDRKEGLFPVRSLHIGTAGEKDSESVCVEYNDILVLPKYRTEFINGILEKIFEKLDWDEFCLDGFSEESIREFLNDSTHFQIREVPSYYFDYSKAGEEEAISQFGYSTRKNLRKNFKKYGEIKTEWAETVEEAESIYADLIRLHQDRWTASGETGSYASNSALDKTGKNRSPSSF